MEQQEILSLSPTGCDWETFQRVWSRVMPQERPGQPVELVPRGEEGRPLTLPEAERLEPTPYDRRETAQRWPARETYLGAESQIYGGEIQDFLTRELADARIYRLLSRNTTGQVARTLATLSAQNRQQAKRLSTAYFLLSGVRYWPEDRRDGSLPGGLLQTLRRQFAREQCRAMDYRTAEATTHDGYLKTLYIALAQAAGAHTWMLRDILEGL